MDIIQLAREMGAAIQKDAEYLALAEAKQRNDEDEGLQQMIAAFNELMAQGEAAADKEDGTMDELGAKIQDSYDEIMSNINMVKYNECKDRVDGLMQKVVAILAAAVNGEDPMTYDPETEEDEHQCGGDCGCCHGCD